MYARFFMIVVALLLGVVSRSVATPTSYFLTDLSLSANGHFTSVMDINNHGAIVGIGSQGAHIYSAGTYRRLEYQYGTAIVPQALNDVGQVAGFIWFPGTYPGGYKRAFFYSDGVVQELGTFGGRDSVATAVNNYGQAVGYAFLTNDDRSRHAFLYSGGTMNDLGTLGRQYSEAQGINNLGQVVGTAYSVESGYTPFVYSDGVMMGIIGDGHGNDINDAGAVVGRTYFPEVPGSHAFVYSNGLLTDLGTLGDPQSFSMATGINARGEVIGVGGGDLFLYANGQMQSLNDLIDPTLGWTLDSVVAINDLGQIIGQGRNHSGQSRPYLLTPVPEPATLGLVAIGTIVIWTRKRRRC